MKKIKYLVMLLGWLGYVAMIVLTFYFSGQSGEQSLGLSDRIALLLGIEAQGDLPPSAVPLFLGFSIRKFAHMGLYFCLAIFAYLATIFQKSWWRHLLTAMLLALLAACIDEYHQTFVANRSGAIRDVGIDMLGASVALLFSTLVYELTKIKMR